MTHKHLKQSHQVPKQEIKQVVKSMDQRIKIFIIIHHIIQLLIIYLLKIYRINCNLVLNQEIFIRYEIKTNYEEELCEGCIDE
jgi:hypothetical protein